MHCLLILAVALFEITTSEVPRPRGVSLSRAPLYDTSKEFTCLDNSKSVPFHQVNDDYCDCEDGTDEPGTSACPNGMFHCTNAGHKPLNIASSRVNDGICDCCDGTDEYVSGKCVNNCKELGRSAREEALRRAELVKAGKELRAELSEKGVRLKQEHKQKLQELLKQKEEAEMVLKEKEAVKKEVEDLESAALEQYRKIEEENKRKREEIESANAQVEATETFNTFDSNKDGLIEVAELQSRQSFDKDRNGEVSEEEAKYFLADKDSVNLETFIAEAWPRIKPFLMLDAKVFQPPATQGEGHVEEVPINGQHEEEEYDEGAANGEDAEHEEEDLEEEEEDQQQQEEEDQEEQPADLVYDPETQQLVDRATQARSEFTESENAVRNIQNDIKTIEEYMQKDFGPDESFAPLLGSCYDYVDYEYIYKLCPFDKATQQAKSGSLETRLGTWGKWNGPEDRKYDSMLYDHGQSCWNGPTRSTAVKVSCSSENKLISVSEPNRCEYLFEFTTPSACFDTRDEGREDRHDEL